MKKRNQLIFAKPGAVNNRPALYRQKLFSILIFAVLLTGCLPPAAAQFIFDKYEIVINSSAKRQTVLTGFLLGGKMLDLAVLNIDEKDNRRLAIYAFEGDTWKPKINTTLRPDVLFVDVINISGVDRLVTYGRDRLNWFDPETAKEHELVAVTSNFNPPRSKGEIHHVDISRDVNGDERDDLVMPDSVGFRVFIQLADSRFAGPLKIGAPTEISGIYGADGYRYNPWSQSRVHEIDYNRDGRRDLVFWNKDHFAVHLQDERGLFAPLIKTFTTDVAFDSDNISSLVNGDVTGKILHSLTDLNGDGIADMVIFSLVGKGISRKRSAYEIHFGKAASDGGTDFAREFDTIIRSDRIQLKMDPYDFDRDGQLEIMLTTIKIANLKSNLLWNFRGFMGGSLNLVLEFYRLEGDIYPGKPNFTRKIKLRFPPNHSEPGWIPLDLALRGATDENLTPKERERGAFNSLLLIGDLTGDSRSDLLIGWKRKQMLAFIGVPGQDLFARRPNKINEEMPNDGEYAWLADINQDDKQDVLIHYPSTTEPHRVAMLISR